MTKVLFEFTDDEIKERFADVWTIAEYYRDGILANMADQHLADDIEINIDIRRLYLAVESAYQDIARYKNYHQDDPKNTRLDATKRGAFMIKWLTRFKPLEPYRQGEIEPSIDFQEIEILQTINEDFALYVTELYLSEELDVELTFSVMKRKELSYDLLFRNMSKDAWIAILKLIKECAPHVETIPFLELVPD